MTQNILIVASHPNQNIPHLYTQESKHNQNPREHINLHKILKKQCNTTLKK
jgi:hypothetical protein